MKIFFHALLASTLLLFTACGGSDEPAIEVDEAKVPSPDNESGTVTMEERSFDVSLQAPSPAWSVKVSEVAIVGHEIWVLAELSQKDGMATQVITEISDSVTAKAPDIAVITYIIAGGEGWKPPETPSLKVIASKAEIARALDAGVSLWPES